MGNKILDNLLKEVMVHVAGKQAEELAILLNTKNYVNEFIIAKKLGLTINQTRNLLYKISNCGLLSSIRKKDKKKGWYTYFWKIEILKSLEFLKQILDKQIEQLNYQIKGRQIKQFYICERCNIELTEETALLHNFTCNECGDVFKLKDNSRMIRELKRSLDRFERKLILVSKEIQKEQEKADKIKLKEIKKIEKEKEAERKKKSLERKKLFLKKKAEVKKPVKKKIAKKKAGAKKPAKKKFAKKKIKKKKVVEKKTKKKAVKKGKKR